MKGVKHLIMSLLLCFLSFGAACAGDEAKNEDISYISEEERECLSGTLIALGYDYDDEVFITQDIQVEGDTKETAITFVYDENKVIGEFIKTYDSYGEHVCFVIEDSNDLLEFIIEGKMAVIDDDNSLIVQSETDAFLLQGKGDVEKKRDTVYYDTVYSSEFEIADGVEITGENNRTAYEYIYAGPAGYLGTIASSGGFAEVPTISNSICVDNNAGLCWAASGASIVNFLLDKSYTATTFYNAVKKVLGGIPVGTKATEKAMFGIFGLSCICKEGKIPYQAVELYLEQGKPIFVSLGGDYNHAVVLCGAYHIYSSYAYIYMDPNVSGKYVLNYLDYSTINNISTDFSYYGGQYYYSRWKHTIYNFKAS